MITKPAITAVIAVLAILVTLQLRSSTDVRQALSLANQQNLATEVAQNFADSKKLERQLTKIEEELARLESTATSSKDRRETLETKLNDLKIVTGIIAVQGEGLELTFEKGLTVPQLTDLMNALRSIGADAIAVNGSRFLWNSGIDGAIAEKPLTIQAIGKKSLLVESLKRRGGIFEQIGQPQSLQEKDNLKISAR